jgi:hypothetical protein
LVSLDNWWDQGLWVCVLRFCFWFWGILLLLLFHRFYTLMDENDMVTKICLKVICKERTETDASAST